MDPESHWVKASLFGVIDQVPESPYHKFSNFFMTVHQHINSIQNIKSFDRMKGIFTSDLMQEDTF